LALHNRSCTHMYMYALFFFFQNSKIRALCSLFCRPRRTIRSIDVACTFGNRHTRGSRGTTPQEGREPATRTTDSPHMHRTQLGQIALPSTFRPSQHYTARSCPHRMCTHEVWGMCLISRTIMHLHDMSRCQEPTCQMCSSSSSCSLANPSHSWHRSCSSSPP